MTDNMWGVEIETALTHDTMGYKTAVSLCEVLVKIFPKYKVTVYSDVNDTFNITIYDNELVAAFQFSLANDDDSDITIYNIVVSDAYAGKGIFREIITVLENSFYGVQFNRVCNAKMKNILRNRGYIINRGVVYDMDEVRFYKDFDTILMNCKHADKDFIPIEMYKLLKSSDVTEGYM